MNVFFTIGRFRRCLTNVIVYVATKGEKIMSIGLYVDDFVPMGSTMFDLAWINQNFDPSSR